MDFSSGIQISQMSILQTIRVEFTQNPTMNRSILFDSIDLDTLVVASG